MDTTQLDRIARALTNNPDSALELLNEHQRHDAWIDYGATRYVCPLSSITEVPDSLQATAVVKFEPYLYTYDALSVSSNYTETHLWNNNSQLASEILVPVHQTADSYLWQITDYAPPVRNTNVPTDKHHAFIVDDTAEQTLSKRFMNNGLVCPDLRGNIALHDDALKLHTYGHLPVDFFDAEVAEPQSV